MIEDWESWRLTRVLEITRERGSIQRKVCFEVIFVECNEFWNTRLHICRDYAVLTSSSNHCMCAHAQVSWIYERAWFLGGWHISEYFECLKWNVLYWFYFIFFFCTVSIYFYLIFSRIWIDNELKFKRRKLLLQYINLTKSY